MKRIGHESSPNSAMNETSSPRLTAPVETRQAPIISRRAVASVGSASSAASNVART
jgi:hypothetical protein